MTKGRTNKDIPSGSKASPEVYRSFGTALTTASDVPVYRQIEQLVEDAIENGTLLPGEKLPPERQLMELIGVSRSTLRVALAELIRRHYLSATQGRGNFVLGPRRQKNLRFLALEKFRADHWQVSPVHYDWISSAAKENGVQIHYHYTSTLEELMDTLHHPPPGYDGLIIFRTMPEWSTALNSLSEEELAQLPIPIMVIGRPIHRPRLNAINYDYLEATRQATRLLTDQGHQRIALVSGFPAPGHSFQEFFDGYRAGLQDAGLAYDEKRALLIKGMIFQGGATPDEIYTQMRDFLKTCDATACVVCLLNGPFEKVVQSLGMIIPDRFSTIAVTEAHTLETSALRWTAMLEPSAMIVQRGVELLAEVCRGEREPGTHEVIAPKPHRGGTTTVYRP